MVPDRILSVNASIDTIGEILLKIIPTLEEVSCHNNCAYKQRAVQKGSWYLFMRYVYMLQKRKITTESDWKISLFLLLLTFHALS